MICVSLYGRFVPLRQADPNLRHMDHEGLHAMIGGLVGHHQTLTRETPVLLRLRQAGFSGLPRRTPAAAKRSDGSLQMHET